MKIIHIPRRFTTRAWGGTETCIINLARSQQRAGHQVEIFTSKALDTTERETIEGVSVRRFDYFYPWLNLSECEKRQMDQSGGNLFSPSLFRALVAAPRASLFHTHTGKRLGGIVRAAARLKKIPYVASMHGGVFDVPAEISVQREQQTRQKFEWGKALGAMVGARKVFNDAGAVFCLSKAELQASSDAFSSKIEYLPNGVDAGRFASGDADGFRQRHGIPADASLILVMGRIDPQKNQRQLVQLMPALRQRVHKPFLLMIGHVTDPGYHDALMVDVNRVGKSDIKVIPGIDHDNPDIVNAYHAADVFCLPSIHEPFGLVILEAWAAGTPVVASAVGGIPDFTRDGQDALLCQSPDAWVGSIASALDPEKRTALCRAGQQRIMTEFDWSIISQKTTRIYEELAA